MKGHTLRALPFVAFAFFAACLVAAPARAQNSNAAPITTAFSVAILQGNLTVENGSGQILYTANDLAVTEELPADLENMVATNSGELAGFTPFSFPPYVLSNLPSMVDPTLTDYEFLTDGFPELSNLPDWNGNVPPALFLNSQGTLATTSFSATNSVNQFFTDVITPDLLANDPFNLPISSSSIQETDNYFNMTAFDPSGVEEVDSYVGVPYFTDNIVEVTPEASSILLLIAGLAGFGLFAWTRRRKAAS